MSAPQFTPGPWKLTSISQDTGAIGICKDRIMIAEVHNGYSFMDVVQQKHPKEQFANAYLIETAPELYEALLQVRHGAEYPDELGDIIYAALAKARGEQS